MKRGPGQLLSDLYRDLRDRRLLPVVGLLAVAIAAVPVALKNESEPVPPPSAPVAADAENGKAVPAVLIADEGVRNYRKRLDLLRMKNPFEEKFQLPTITEGGLEDVTAVSDTSVTGVSTEATVESGDAGVSVSTGDTSTSSGDDTASADSSSDGGGGGSGDSGGSSADDSGQSETLYTYHVSVLAGPAGEEEPYEDVEPLTVLPGAAAPVAIFAGATEDGKRAVFMVSSDVTGTSGEGSCLPSASDCEYLVLREGQSRSLDYASAGGPSGTYVLELTSIDLVPVDEGGGGNSKEAQRTSIPSVSLTSGG